MYCLLMQAAWISILYRGLACTVNTGAVKKVPKQKRTLSGKLLEVFFSVWYNCSGQAFL